MNTSESSQYSLDLELVERMYLRIQEELGLQPPREGPWELEMKVGNEGALASLGRTRLQGDTVCYPLAREELHATAGGY